MQEKIKDIIQSYKDDFAKIDEEERYKWEAYAHYKKHWKLEADEFVPMLTESLKSASNLLAGGMYYPYKMLVDYAKTEPEIVRGLFRMLYDEALPLSERILRFRESFEQQYSTKKLNHYQDIRAISVYLSFEYPEKYYLYKYMMYKDFAKRIGYTESIEAKTDGEKYEKYMKFCSQVLEIIEQDAELIEMSKSRLDDDCYKDNSLHVLTQDIIFYGSHAEKNEYTGYWPTLKEYDPKLSVEDWQSFLEEDKIKYPSTLAMLKAMLELGGEATCKHLGEFLGEHQSSCISRGSYLGRRVKLKFNLPACMDNEKERYFAIPFIGKYYEENRDLYVWKLRPELREALQNMDLSTVKVEKATETDISKNTILYGPPGTGKTYNTVIYAVAIIENKPLGTMKEEEYKDVLERYNQYKSEGLIEFTTFHQSYGYEDFIEGIKPVTTVSGDVSYSVQPGVFKKFCEESTNEIDFDTAWESLISTAKQQETYQFTRRSGNMLEVKYKDDSSFVVNWSGGTSNTLNKDSVYKQWSTMKYSDKKTVPNGGKRWVFEANQAIIDELVRNYGMKPTYSEETVHKNRVFIIDEINRGNISKIFGELITLIEPSKRVGMPEGMQVKLPNSPDLFGVPDNIYIIGTMNTADRSIATIDTALRRRFRFKEMLPDVDVLENVMVENICIKDMLEKINKRISVLYDREHTIGHAYFVPLKIDNSLAQLSNIFGDNIIPLLQEYFYEDYEKIRLVLGDNMKKDISTQFVKQVEYSVDELFGSEEYDLDTNVTYEINKAAFDNVEAYRLIYIR